MAGVVPTPEQVAYLATVVAVLIGGLKLATVMLGGYRERIEREREAARLRRYFPDETEDQTHSIPLALIALKTVTEQLSQGIDSAGNIAAGNALELEGITAKLDATAADVARYGDEMRAHIAGEAKERIEERAELESMIGRMFEDFARDMTSGDVSKYQTRARTRPPSRTTPDSAE